MSSTDDDWGSFPVLVDMDQVEGVPDLHYGRYQVMYWFGTREDFEECWRRDGDCTFFAYPQRFRNEGSFHATARAALPVEIAGPAC